MHSISFPWSAIRLSVLMRSAAPTRSQRSDKRNCDLQQQIVQELQVQNGQWGRLTNKHRELNQREVQDLDWEYLLTEHTAALRASCGGSKKETTASFRSLFLNEAVQYRLKRIAERD